MDDRNAKLCGLLKEAVRLLDALGDAPIASTRYDSGPDIAQFIKPRIDEIEAGTISNDNKKELWIIFAPTCSWDDSVGDVNLGNAIFGLLEELYRDEVIPK